MPSPASVDSDLPNPLTIQGGNLDQDPVAFQYAGHNWASDASVSR